MVGIVGLGLIGGSLGLALRGEEVVGYSRRPETVAAALRCGAITQVAREIEEVAQAGVIIIATPILGVREVFSTLSPHLRPGCLVMDTASTKAQVMAWAKEFIPAGVDFIGGHPMAGRESWGIEAATPDLFHGATFCLVLPPGTSLGAVVRVMDLVEKVGAKPLFLKADEHDFLVAGISHLPLVLAAALVQVTTANPAWGQMAKLAAGSYRDATRVASGNPEMARDICLTNATALRQWLSLYMSQLEQFMSQLEKVGQNLENGDRISEVFDQARQARECWLKEVGWK